MQQEGVDFDDTFAPMARMESVRLLALAAQKGWRVHHMDIKLAFLNGDLKEEVYVHQPLGFVIPGKEGKLLLFFNPDLPRIVITVTLPRKNMQRIMEWFDLAKAEEYLKVWNAQEGAEK